MKHSLPFAVAIALVATSSAAQSGPVAQQSSEDLVCKLSGDCSGAETAATRDKPETRGFSIAKPRQTSRPAVAAPATSASRPNRANVVEPRRASIRNTAPGARVVSSRPAVSAPGRADLMISFVSGSAQLTEQAKSNADQFVAALASPKLSGMRFMIEGHTDAVGSREYNLDLSQRRAQAVVNYLTGKGVSRSRLDMRGYGFDRPIAGDARSPANRRVEVVKAN